LSERPAKSKKTKADIKAKNRASRGLPTPEEITAFIAENPDLAGKREIARAFAIKGSAKIDLKALLKEMAEDGHIEKRGRRLKNPGQLPNVLMLDIVARDRDGGLLARPADLDRASDQKPPVILIRQPKGKEAVAGIGSRVLARLSPGTGEGHDYHANVIKVFDRRQDAQLGIVRMVDGIARLVPITKRQDELIIPDEGLNGARAGDLVEIEPLRASGRGRNERQGLARGKVTQIVGSAITEQAASMIAIHSNDIPHIFPQAVLDEAKSAKPISLKGVARTHEDWRDLPLITIDPADAKDHDDAIHGMADPDNPGGFIATVAIADVSYYVRPGTAMDREALLRGNSVYFPDRVVPMLPERISNDLCSLRENEERPALAVKMWFNSEGKKLRHSFHRIIMRSHAKLAYVEAQAAIDGESTPKATALLDTILKPLWQAYDCLKKGRNTRGPLELDLPERKILLKEDGTVDRVIIPDRLDAHKLVEEFMIQANVCAAETLENKKQPLIYRTHDNPSLDKLESLGEFLKSMGMSIVRSGNLRAQHFNGILKAVEGKEHEELVNQVVLRSQSQAEYSPVNIGHFGLNLMKYAHFTSPIRRYADLIVHRALVGSLGLGPGGITPEEEKLLDVIAADISLTERRAMQAERETKDRLIAGFLSTRIGETFSGRINGVTKSGLFVTLADTGADGFIPISKISQEYYHYDAATHSLIGGQSGLAYQMGMEVEVRLAEAAPVAGALRFDMMSEGKKASGLPRSRRTNQRPFQKTGSRRNAKGPPRGSKRRR
jgi:ribonuclease R